jgi:hypothetical protein
MSLHLHFHVKVDLSFYDDTQLDDAEIIEREAVRQASEQRDEALERERQRRMRSFTFKGGLL